MVKRALLVGINYKNSNMQLNGCINDVSKMKVVLEKKGFVCQVITDDTTKKPTCLNIKEALIQLVKEVQAGDVLVFHYSGHATLMKDPTCVEDKDSVYIPIDYKTNGVIRDTWVFDNICKKIPKGATFWGIMDACRSGTALDLKFNVKSQCKRIIPSNNKQYNESEWSDKYIFTMTKSDQIQGAVFGLSGCMDSEKSADASFNKQSNGAFTKCLLDTIASYPNQLPSLLKLLTEVNARLDLYGFFTQTPQLSISDFKFLESHLFDSVD